MRTLLVAARCRRAALGAVALLALALVWLTGPPQSSPLYDGLCLSAPYRYLGTPPAGVSNGGTPGRQDKVNADLSPGSPIELNTDDGSVGPALAQVVIPGGSLAISAPTTLRAVLEPVTPPMVAPATGHIIGNVYRVALTATDGREIALRPGASLTLYLLPPAVVPGTIIERLDGGTWTALTTTNQPGCTNSLSAPSDRTGVFALVAPNRAPGSSGGGAGSASSSGGRGAVVAVAAGTVALLLAAIVAVRLRRRRGRRGSDGTLQ